MGAMRSYILGMKPVKEFHGLVDGVTSRVRQAVRVSGT